VGKLIMMWSGYVNTHHPTTIYTKIKNFFFVVADR